MASLPVTFLTDYGYEDEFAGSCRLVIQRLTPGATVVDLTHGIPPGDVRRGALALEAAVAIGPAAVHLAVVDPGVGTERRAVAVAARAGGYLVGPDNGLLHPAIARLGGATGAVDISSTALRLEPASATFHGRDLFAPVTAHLAAGRPLEAAGEPVDPATLTPLELPRPEVAEGRARLHVLYADHFGNLVLDARPAELDAALGRARPGRRLSVSAPAGDFAAVLGTTFADGGGRPDGGAGAEAGLVVYEDSSGRVGIAVNLGSAAELLGAERDDEVLLAAAP